MTLAAGIHHITAIAGDPARNVEFYTSFLGLRLVKRTANFDDPSTWHLYYGDEAGNPGTILTFFPFPLAGQGRHGIGQAVEVSFAIPTSSLGWWMERLIGRGIPFEGPEERFDTRVLRFRDPDGLQVELVTDPDAAAREGWSRGSVPAEHATRGFAGVTLWESDPDKTASILTSFLRFRPAGAEAGRHRFVAKGWGPGSIVDVRVATGFWGSAPGAGTVHHVAFRAADIEDQALMSAALLAERHQVTPVQDRQYFRSVYFREPGGVLFEIATDLPGFTVDEPVASLGSMLKLPTWLEPRRSAIASSLPSLGIPGEEPAEAEEDLGFIYRFEPAEGMANPETTLLLLHGTGGSEEDLIELGRAVAPEVALLSPRGPVLENGMPRFFRRFAEGKFDEEDIRRRAGDLSGFLEATAQRHGFDKNRLFALGFSNGANIAAALLLLLPHTLAGAALLRPMVPLTPLVLPDLERRPVLILAGRSDPIAKPDDVERLADLLRRAGAQVDLRWVEGGHGLTSGELPMLREWLAEREVLEGA